DFLVTFDSRYQLRDIYYPNVGQENHTVGEPSRFGVWVDGQFAWTGDDGWDRHITYEHETLVGDTTLVHSKLGLSLRFRDAVDFDRNIYLKEVTVEDALGRERHVRFFQHFDAHLYGNDTGDSAYYDPRSQAVVHYKGRRYFLVSGSSGGSAYGLSSFAIGRPLRFSREQRITGGSGPTRTRRSQSICPTTSTACTNGRPSSSERRSTTAAPSSPRTTPTSSASTATPIPICGHATARSSRMPLTSRGTAK